MLLSLISTIICGLCFSSIAYIQGKSLLTLLVLQNYYRIDKSRENLYFIASVLFVLCIFLAVLCGLLSKISALYTYDLRYDSFNALLNYDQSFYEQPENAPAILACNLAAD
jgi:hypothetical protein